MPTTTFPFRPLSFVCIGFFASLSALACSSTTTTINNPGGDGGTSNSTLADGAATAPGTGTMSNGSGGTCCLNGSFYDCTSKAAYDKCTGFDIDACSKACGPADGMCMSTCFMKWGMATHDPSACTRNASRDSSCSSSPTPSPGGVCSDNGKNCNSDDKCCSSNCYAGTCYGHSAGDHCNADDKCISNNCYAGTCQ